MKQKSKDMMRSAKKRGFTLAEMILVIVIIAILVSGIVVSLQGRQSVYSLKMSVKDLAQAIRYAIAESRLKEHDFRLAFYDDYTKFRVEEIRDTGSAEFVSVAGIAGKKKALADGVEITEIATAGQATDPMPEAIEFSSDGRGFYGTISLQNQKGQTARIEVVEKTGQVYVDE